MNFSAVHTS